MFFKKRNPYIKAEKDRIAAERKDAWERLRHHRERFELESDPEQALYHSKKMAFWAKELVYLDDEERELRKLAKYVR